MDLYHKNYVDQVQQKIADAKVTQLAMAAPLESTNSGPKVRPQPGEETKKTLDHKPPNQKATPVTALLSVGALRPAFAILAKFPWFVDAHVELTDLVLCILRHSISPLYDAVFVLKERDPSFTQPRARYGSSSVLLPHWPERVPLSTTFESG